jgi:hypothetical protein
MKISFAFLVLPLVLASFNCSTAVSPGPQLPSTEPRRPIPVAYSMYDQYSYRGLRPQTNSTLFFYTTTKSAFDSLFFFVYDHSTGDTIPAADLRTKKVIAVVKYGDNYYDMSVREVGIRDGSLVVEYNCNLVTQNMTWIAAIPIIITTSADFHKIQFVENGMNVKEIVP